jgi:hypothetical protein
MIFSETWKITRAVFITLVLMLSMATCATTKIEYAREIPAVPFPVFPPPDCVEYNEATDTVTMPLWYWQKIAEYKIDVDAAHDYLRQLRTQAALSETSAAAK